MPAKPAIIPRHIAIIMDGNGRWASQRGLPRLKGHEAGAKSVREVMNYCRKTGVHYLTLYAFSTENWQRPSTEVKGLMSLLRYFLQAHENDLHANRVRLRVMGRREDMDPAVQQELERIETATREYSERQLILALSYSGRTELIRATRLIADEALKGKIAVPDINEETISAHLYLPDVPDPDLVIRTSGEIRLSNFMLWQAAYSEWYFTATLWPDFREDDFNAALVSFANRERRYGCTGEQVKTK